MNIDSYLDFVSSLLEKGNLINDSIEKIDNCDTDHYYCTGCNKFPIIELCKDMENVVITCSCFNNKKITIKELYNLINININTTNFFSDSTPKSLNTDNILLCSEHQKPFKGFSQLFLNNFCEECIKQKISKNDIILFEDLKIEEKKLEDLIKLINEVFNSKDMPIQTLNISENTLKFIKIKENYYTRISKDDKNRFKRLFNIILNDYQKYPNFSHFFYIKNYLDFFNIENKSNDLEEKKDDNFILINEAIIIEYINNISNKTKLFSKIFVKNNKKTFKVEIEGKLLPLVKDYEFKTKEKIVRVKLYLKANSYEINFKKMFYNCTNLIYVNGISKIMNIVNLDKMFYNCISLSHIPDFEDWKINKKKSYLMLFNCISFIFFPSDKELNLKNIDEGGLNGILVTKYLNFKNEIIINNINEDNKGYINLFKNRIKVEDKNKEIIILDGRDKQKDLIACYKYDKTDDENELNVFNKSENKDGNDIKIKIKIITKIKDMNEIIERNELEILKWNTNNVTNMEYLFYNCSSLSSLPDI